MDLITPELRSAIQQFPLGSQEGLCGDAKVLVKFFFPAGHYIFFVTEGEEQHDDILLFGYAIGFDAGFVDALLDQSASDASSCPYGVCDDCRSYGPNVHLTPEGRKAIATRQPGTRPFGLVCDEWGYTTLSELQSVRVRGLTIKRDLHLPFATRTVGELLRSAA